MIVRVAHSHELDRIYLMGFDAWSDGADRPEYLRVCRESPKYKRGQWLVLSDGDKIVSSLITYAFDEHTVGIGSVTTSPEFRCRGHASLLISETLKRFESDATTFYLYAEIAPEFYEKFGFRRLPAALQKYPDTVCMTKRPDPLPPFSDLEKIPKRF